MSETPTPYDLTQDALIGPMRDILLTAAEPPSGPEFSYPVVDQAVSSSMWQDMMKAFGSGIVSYGQYPYRLDEAQTSDINNSVVIVPATDVKEKDSVGIIEGFVHSLEEPKTLTVPAVATRTRYLIALQYDPTQHDRPGGPIKLDVFAGTLDQSQGKRYVLIYEGWRDPSTVVSSITWTPVRARVGGNITVSRADQLPNPHHSGLLWGTRAYADLDGSEWMLRHRDDGQGMRWDPIHQPVRHLITMYTPHRTVMEQSRTPRVDILNGIAYLHGGFRMANGSAFTAGGDGWHLGSLPAVARPPRQYDLPGVAFAPNPGVVRIRVETSGAIRAFLERSSHAVTLDGLSFPLT